LTAEQEPHLVDIHVGARVRMRRKAMGLSQTQLAESIGITFQQMQKYERGANRVSASKLYGIATTLQASVAWFFEGLSADLMSAGEDPANYAQRTKALQRFVLSGEGMELASLFPRVPAHQRRQILALARALGDPGDESDEEGLRAG
jgi:transcriptional regulator with XRE-family HTH domain